MNSDDVLRDLKTAQIQRRRVYVSRSCDNGKIRWIIEIERNPASEFGNTMKHMLDRLGQREQRDEEEEWR